MERDEILILCNSNSEVIVSYIADLESRSSDLDLDIMQRMLISNPDIVTSNPDTINLNLKILNFGNE
jgi:hypothetical protein